jgi:hypothetical protein
MKTLWCKNQENPSCRKGWGWRSNTPTKYKHILYRVSQCMSPRRNWDSPTPSLASECAPPPGTKGRGAHSPAGWGSPNSDDWRNSLALCYSVNTLLPPLYFPADPWIFSYQDDVTGMLLLGVFLLLCMSCIVCGEYNILQWNWQNCQMGTEPS